MMRWKPTHSQLREWVGHPAATKILKTRIADPGEGIMKTVIVMLATTLLSLVGMAFAQTKPGAAGPTKVTGDPIKTASGLEYWDIKVGTGAVAEAGHKVKVDYTGWLTARSSIARSAAGVRLSLCWAPGRSSRDGTRESRA